MGRPRKVVLPVTARKTMKCSCGESVVVAGDCANVICVYCLNRVKKMTKFNDVDKMVVDKSGANHKQTIIVDTSKEDGPVVKRGRGRPRKNAVLSADKKGNKKMDTNEKKVEVKGGSGKRGRKATVGAAVLSFIKGKSGDVPFTDILGVYSSEREKMGKKGTPEIETRNCYSTLYVMCRDGKLAEVAKKQTYRAV